jgi:hypothetical protein
MRFRRPINDSEVLHDLDRRMSGYGNGVRLAESLDMDPAHLRSIRSGYRTPSIKVAAALGYELRWVKRNRLDLIAQLKAEGGAAHE